MALNENILPPLLEHTCWRDLEVAHPPEWEMIMASPAEEPVGCTFADRWFERLKVKCRPMKRCPNLARLLEEKQDKEAGKIERLEGQPEGWHGMVQSTGDGRVVHAGRFFEWEKTLVEIIVIWPDRRDTQLERQVMAGIRMADTSAPAARWDAMGLHVGLSRDLQLKDFETDVGRITWKFGPGKKGRKKDPPLLVRRLAVPRYWLRMPLEEWLSLELEADRTAIEKRRITFNGHGAARLVSTGPARGMAALAGRVPMRVDVAWRCPVEERVYLVRYTESLSPHGLIDLPAHLKIECCKPHRIWGKNPKDRRPPRKKEEEISVADVLDSVPMVNRASRIRKEGRGGALIEVPIRRPRYMVPPLSWLLPFSRSRRVELDVLGATILDLCDGRRTVNEVIEIFGADNRLTFREAHLSVMAFMRLLSERGVIAIAGLKNAAEK